MAQGGEQPTCGSVLQGPPHDPAPWSRPQTTFTPQSFFHTHSHVVDTHTAQAPAASYLVTLLAFSLGSCWPTSPKGCTLPWDTAGHLGESRAKTGEARQPRLRNLPKDRAARALVGALGWPQAPGQSAEASLPSVARGPRWAPDQLVSPLGSDPEELSRAT